VVLFAGAVSELPSEIAAQLAEEGRLVVVIRPENGVGRAVLARRTAGLLARRVIFDAAIPLLRGFEPKPAFVF
jgi:protein-L-isoaspartate(D-aspartate) O-methyltransferase